MPEIQHSIVMHFTDGGTSSMKNVTIEWLRKIESAVDNATTLKVPLGNSGRYEYIGNSGRYEYISGFHVTRIDVTPQED